MMLFKKLYLNDPHFESVIFQIVMYRLASVCFRVLVQLFLLFYKEFLMKAAVEIHSDYIVAVEQFIKSVFPATNTKCIKKFLG